MSWTDSFPALSTLDSISRGLLVDRGLVTSAPAGSIVFGPGRVPEHMLLLLNGIVRVQQTSESGRELVLYRVRAGESCIMTTACLLAGDAYAAEGVAETDLRAVSIPRAVFDSLLSKSSAFRSFVFEAYGRRIADLILTIEDIAFRRVDQRLAETLLRFTGPDGTVRATHQDLAKELGTAREVVSRQLAEFQRRGWTEQTRGAIRLLNLQAITDFSEGM